MSKKLINPEELFDDAAFGMSQATIETKLGLVFISGQVDLNRKYQITEKSVEGQTNRTLQNISVVLKNANLSVDNLLQIRIYSLFK